MYKCKKDEDIFYLTNKDKSIITPRGLPVSTSSPHLSELLAEDLCFIVPPVEAAIGTDELPGLGKGGDK